MKKDEPTEMSMTDNETNVTFARIMAKLTSDEVRVLREVPEEIFHEFLDKLRKAQDEPSSPATDDGPFRRLAEQAAQSPEAGKLLEALCKLKEAHGSEGLDSLLDMWGDMNRPPNRRLDN